MVRKLFRKKSEQELRYEYFAKLTGAVDNAIELIRNFPTDKVLDEKYVQDALILKLGLNNEALNEQPSEFSAYFGVGLHLWQYPNQLSRYLVWLAKNANTVSSYMEIGCRWGGTFILVSEWLKKCGAPLKSSCAVDPIEPTPFIKRYMEIADHDVKYMRLFSTSPEFHEFATNAKPEFVFVDGDHSFEGVMNDHMLVREFASIIAHHDVSSDACPGTTLFWKHIKKLERDYCFYDFTDQYESVKGSYLGIGVMERSSSRSQ